MRGCAFILQTWNNATLWMHVPLARLFSIGLPGCGRLLVHTRSWRMGDRVTVGWVGWGFLDFRAFLFIKATGYQ